MFNLLFFSIKAIQLSFACVNNRNIKGFLLLKVLFGIAKIQSLRDFSKYPSEKKRSFPAGFFSLTSWLTAKRKEE